MNSVAAEEGGGERRQPRDLKQAQHGQGYRDSNNNKQLSTFARHSRKLSVKLAPAISITNMSVSIQRGESCGPKEGEIPVAVLQPGQTLGPGKDKSDKLGQDEEWARIPDLLKPSSTLRLAKGGGGCCRRCGWPTCGVATSGG